MDRRHQGGRAGGQRKLTWMAREWARATTMGRATQRGTGQRGVLRGWRRGQGMSVAQKTLAKEGVTSYWGFRDPESPRTTERTRTLGDGCGNWDPRVME